ncbi:MAG: Pyruvate carboxylase, C-terminal domain/subunit [Caldanaerobacter subterraneus]|jgi:oxaloacetate decarboxylase alpha subunit|uniref:Oxaloacetate decarboxylase subunit alpha n=1 Tax=Caldanaerobacter subterraneus TaxID=911092 RepID=A0A117KWJ0_9THEO|nr:MULTISPECIES: oxaloacetate decarboxylase subunit alpha [Caldanaerobacter]KUK09681.1 MAG: Pyruvate carboxylase, C-terminal domain/subunit [Caldanaerobacter subterraneus]MDI3519581.1 oxaloacetate decarboxylase (Na+ extruding) subunit alpha [Caldanaerobacter sp.]HBT48742.1 oxaloacetate decarboxylase subunit alpha [Caldanaerobacter subterraneus]
MSNKVKITETVLRDAHQSLMATRMTTEEMLPIAEKLDKVGYHSLEVWGGATFDACLRFLNEDPWERLRELKKRIKNTPLQMLLRGQNLVGYRHYPDDIVEKFIEKAVANGIDIIRIFDALNDVRNLEVAIKATKRVGAHAQGTLVYTISPVHTIDHYIRVAKELVELGVDSICIKDMSGILSPYVAYELVKRLKETVNVPIQLHSHYTSGMASMTYLKAIEAGVDAIDTAISPLALGTSQPATETMVAALKGTQYDTGLDLELLSEIASYFKEVKRNHYKETEFSMVMGVDTDVLVYQVPGGMLSNLIAQLKEQKALDKYEEVLKEIPKVREDLGYPPLVTPMSQMVGTQAVLNVITGERYKMVPKEVKDYVKGLYGRPPAPISEEVKRKIIGDEETIKVRPADLLKPQFEEAKEEIKEYYEQEEDVLTYVLFPQIAKKFFEYRRARKYYIDSTLINSEYMTYPV